MKTTTTSPVLTSIIISDLDWKEAFKAANAGAGNLSLLSGVFDPSQWQKGRYELIFKTRRTGYDHCGTEVPQNDVIVAIKNLGLKYNLAYSSWDESEKGYGEFYFAPFNEKGVARIKTDAFQYTEKREDGNYEMIGLRVVALTKEGEFHHFHEFKGKGNGEKAGKLRDAVESKNLEASYFTKSNHWTRV